MGQKTVEEAYIASPQTLELEIMCNIQTKTTKGPEFFEKGLCMKIEKYNYSQCRESCTLHPTCEGVNEEQIKKLKEHHEKKAEVAYLAGVFSGD